MIDDDNPLTRAAINQIAWEIREGDAEPEQARQLLGHFCDLVESRQLVPPELLTYMKDAMRAYLAGEKTLESALGLARKRGRPKADQQTRIQMAAEVLRCRLGGMSHQDSLSEVAKNFNKAESVIGEAWADWAQDGLFLLRIERSLDQYPWTPEEVEKLTDIFHDKSWFVAPGKSLN
ncbi:MAG: hypothetical protein PVI91_16825 [Gammaproteobacteria bacterium]|jgi:hypothetical protein